MRTRDPERGFEILDAASVDDEAGSEVKFVSGAGNWGGDRMRVVARSFLLSVEGDSDWISEKIDFPVTGMRYAEQARRALADVMGESPLIRADDVDELHIAYPGRLLVIVQTDPVGKSNKVSMAGRQADVQAALAAMPRAPRDPAPRVLWEIRTERGTKRIELDLKSAKPVRDEFYPWFPEGVDAYIEAYLTSPEMILLLRGAPGVGKTSFIRHLLLRSRMNAVVTHDKCIYGSDAYLIDHLVEEEDCIMVLDDADVLVLSRELSGNEVMAKFLNIADGLVDTRGRKLIISANLVEDEKIDAALLRPGRCFDAPVFRPLTYAEAAKASLASGLPSPAHKGEHTLAELFASRDAVLAEKNDLTRRRVGFR